MAFVSLEAIGWTTLAAVLYILILVIYRLHFHPLAKFPGPKIAAATGWWECIQDLFGGLQGGDYINQVERMHDEYGARWKETLALLKMMSPDASPRSCCARDTRRNSRKRLRMVTRSLRWAWTREG